MPRTTVKTDVGIGNTIRSRLDPWAAMTVVIDSSKVTAVGGKKILKAGTLLGAAETGVTIMANNAKAMAVNSALTEGLLFYDVDVTNGDCEASMLYMGTVGLDRIPAAPVAAAKTALTRVTFTKD